MDFPIKPSLGVALRLPELGPGDFLIESWLSCLCTGAKETPVAIVFAVNPTG